VHSIQRAVTSLNSTVSVAAILYGKFMHSSLFIISGRQMKTYRNEQTDRE